MTSLKTQVFVIFFTLQSSVCWRLSLGLYPCGHKMAASNFKHYMPKQQCSKTAKEKKTELLPLPLLKTENKFPATSYRIYFPLYSKILLHVSMSGTNSRKYSLSLGQG